MKHHIVAFAVILAIGIPMIVGAQTTGGGTFTTGSGSGGAGTITTIPHATATSQTTTGTVKLENPLGNNVRSIPDFFYLVINFVYSLSYAVIAGFLLVSGFKFVMAQGKPDALDDAKRTFKYTIIGAIILIGANVATEVVRSVINQFVVTSI